MDTKEKRAYFDDLHKELALKVGGDPSFIGQIRSSVFSYGATRESLLEQAQERLNRKGYQKGRSRSDTRRHSLKFYIDKIAFLEKLTDDDWKLIIQKTEHDRKDNAI